MCLWSEWRMEIPVSIVDRNWTPIPSLALSIYRHGNIIAFCFFLVQKENKAKMRGHHKA